MRPSTVAACALAVLLHAAALGAEPVIRWVDFEDKYVLPGFEDRIIRAIDDADREANDLVVVQLDTPGGMVSSMETIVKRMLAAKTPIVVWVGPSGARAGSAGFFILIAADVAAMAPGTRAGAASVVFGAGKSEEGDVLLKKANQDAAALVRTIAEHRGRNVEACEKAVFAADAYTDKIALESGIVDLVAKDRDDLLGQLDGKAIHRFDGSVAVLRTAGARFVQTETHLQQKFIEFVASPVMAYLLLILGLGGLYVELTHPGLVFPGVVGVLCLLLFALASRVLPVSTVGLLLILLAVVMFILEIKVASYGMLTVGGTVCLVIGSLMLFRGPIPELRLPISVALPPALALAALCAVAVRLAVRAQRAAVGTGVEGLVGEVAEVTQDLVPEGKVFVHGELWDATLQSGVARAGQRVRVVRVDNMRLVVETVGTGPAGREDA